MKKKKTVQKKIVETWNETSSNHRPDFETCPHCRKETGHTEWDKYAVVMVLQPRIYKSGCAAIVCECPHCFEQSWTHEKYDRFDWNSHFPEEWKVKAKEKEMSIKLSALREWGEGICYKCKHLESGNIEYHAWRTCIRGCGPAEKQCPKFEPYKK